MYYLFEKLIVLKTSNNFNNVSINEKLDFVLKNQFQLFKKCPVVNKLKISIDHNILIGMWKMM